MKKSILLLAALLSWGASVASAQQEAQVPEPVSAEYNRSSLSWIFTQKGDKYDAQIKAISESNPGEKFDYNNISLRLIKCSVGREQLLGEDVVSEFLEKEKVGKEVVAYIFNRKSNGLMDDNLLKARGVYNAKAQDMEDAAATQVGAYAIQASGSKLLKQSYVMLLDYAVVYTPEQQTQFGKTDAKWDIHSVAYVYKLKLTDEGLTEFYKDCWIYADDSAETKAAKIASWNEYEFPLALVATATNTTTVKEEAKIQEGIDKAYPALLEKLEKKIEDWQVKATVCDIKPIRSKIGTKEGVKNGDRYQVWGYEADEEGNVSSKKKGFVRATMVAENAGTTASDETDPSEFYQIGGFKAVEDGQLLQQSKDLRLSIYPYYKYSFSHMTDLNIGIDYLASINTKGMCQYGLINVGFDLGGAAKLKTIGYQLPDGSMANDFMWINVSLGYGFGIHLSRFVELIPYLSVGMDNVSSSTIDKYYKNDETMKKKMFTACSGWYGDLGLRANFLPYPFQIFAIADFSFLFAKGSIYNDVNALLGDRAHKSGFNLGAGIRYCF